MDPKSSIQFFHRKFELFSNFFHFSFFIYISSPISESFIAQLLLHRALDIFFHRSGEFLGFSLPAFCQCSKVKDSCSPKPLAFQAPGTENPRFWAAHRPRVWSNPRVARLTEGRYTELYTTLRSQELFRSNFKPCF